MNLAIPHRLEGYPFSSHSQWSQLSNSPHQKYFTPFNLPSYSYSLYRQPNQTSIRKNHLLSQITKAINGEYAAISCYHTLKNIAPSKKEQTVITEIRKDEIRHYNIFSNLYTQLTGKKHTPIMKEKCPTNYRKGIDAAFLDEQETVDMYLEIAYNTTNHQVKEAFLRAAHDEQNHAVWFLYFMK